MKKLYLSLVLSLTLSMGANAQLADGALFPDVTFTDINGQTHRIYDYLDSGKIVILDLFASWCGPCWTLHTNHVLGDIWEEFGPNGTDQIVVFAIEVDPSTPTNELYGGPNSQGDWSAGVDYFFGEDNNLAAAAQIAFYPSIYLVRPNGSTILANDYAWANLLDPGFNYIADLSFRGDIDAGVSANYRDTYFCGQYQLGTFTASVRNFGNEPLTSATVNAYVNGELVRTKEWTGVLTTFRSANVTLPGVSISGNSELVLEVVNPNGIDEPTPGDNVYPWTVSTATATETVTLTITTDKWPEEVNWRAEGPSGNILVSNSDLGTLQCETTYTQSFPYSEEGCYKFVISDGFGDGLLNGGVNPASHTCTNGDPNIAIGAISLSIDGLVIFDNASYGAGTNVPYSFTLESSVPEIPGLSSMIVFPNPTTDELNITFDSQNSADVQVRVVDILGATVKNFGKQNVVTGTNQLRFNVEELTSGSYFIQMVKDEGVKTIKFQKM